MKWLWLECMHTNPSQRLASRIIHSPCFEEDYTGKETPLEESLLWLTTGRMPLAGWLQLKAPHAEYDSVCSRSAYTSLPKRLRDSCCYTEMLSYEPHGKTEIFIKDLPTSLGGAAVCIWLQQLLGCGWMKINTSFTAWLFWLLKVQSNVRVFPDNDRWTLTYASSNHTKRSYEYPSETIKHGNK